MGQHHEIHLGDEGSVANALRIVMRNYFSTQLLAGAARMAELARRIEDDHTGESRFDLEHRGYVLSSVLSAVGFLEAMVNELFQDAHGDHAPDGGAITPLDANTRLLVAEYWRSTEQGKGRALDKYQALLRFAGEPVLSQGAQPFQDASLAVQLRNAIAHYRPQDLSADTPSLMEQRLIGGSRRRRNGRARELRCPSSNGLARKFARRAGWRQLGLPPGPHRHGPGKQDGWSSRGVAPPGRPRNSRPLPSTCGRLSRSNPSRRARS